MGKAGLTGIGCCTIRAISEASASITIAGGQAGVNIAETIISIGIAETYAGKRVQFRRVIDPFDFHRQGLPIKV